MGSMRCHPALHLLLLIQLLLLLLLLLLLKQDRSRQCGAELAAGDGAWVQTSRQWSLGQLRLMRGRVAAAHALQVHDEGGSLLGRQRAPLHIEPQPTRPSSATHGW